MCCADQAVGMRAMNPAGGYAVPSWKKGSEDCGACTRVVSNIPDGRILRWCKTCKRLVDVGPAHFWPAKETPYVNSFGQVL